MSHIRRSVSAIVEAIELRTIDVITAADELMALFFMQTTLAYGKVPDSRKSKAPVQRDTGTVIDFLSK